METKSSGGRAAGIQYQHAGSGAAPGRPGLGHVPEDTLTEHVGEGELVRVLGGLNATLSRLTSLLFKRALLDRVELFVDAARYQQR